MQLDFLIVGQGIAGTWLSYFLDKARASYLVIDLPDAKAPSRIAAGIINPVTGRRYLTTWMADTLLPFVAEAYTNLGQELSINAISRREIIDFFPTPQMRLAFLEQAEEQQAYMQTSSSEQQTYHELFHYDLGYGIIRPAYTAHLDNLLPAWRDKLRKERRLIEEKLDHSLLQISDNAVRYGDWQAKKMIFCDGLSQPLHPAFENLPFAPNKGEALLLDIPDLPQDNIYKRGMMLVPLAQPGKWWLGSGYQWNFPDLEPTSTFREKAEELLRHWLKLPYSVTGHLAGNRPATIERRPFVGLHPHYPAIGILNGLGTKGCSLAPYLAQQFCDHLLFNTPLQPEVDIHRFARVLSR